MRKDEIAETNEEMTAIKQRSPYRLDLTRIDGDGDVSCPKCGTTISPDDNTEESYTILEPRVSHRGLEILVIRCNTCSSHIHLTGFSLLQEISEADGGDTSSQETGELFAA